MKKYILSLRTSGNTSIPQMSVHTSPLFIYRLSLLVLIILCINTASHAQGTWTPVADTAPHYNAGVMLLLTDGTVIVKNSSGGSDSYGKGWDKLTPDIHGSYANGKWTSIASMAQTRLYFSSQVLKDGRVYVAGGEYGTGRTEGEIYNPLLNTWSEKHLPLPTDTLSDANSEILDNGDVLQAVVISGDMTTKHIYYFDPIADTYAVARSSLGYNNESAWVKLPDNSILYMDIYSATAERYIPSLANWLHDANVPVDLYDPYGYETGAAFMLPDGKAFFIGSTSKTEYYIPSGNTGAGRWVAGPPIPDSLGAPDAAAAMMVNGNILCAFAHTPINDSNIFIKPMSFYEFNYLTDSFTRINAPNGMLTVNKPAYFSNMLCLPDGSILYGQQGSDQYYLYKPGSAALAAGKPAISNIIRTGSGCDSFIATGTLFNGITEGAGYGDDWQMASNYPIIRLLSNDTVYYARTYNWTSTGVQRDTMPDTTMFVLPAGIPEGTYSLQVVANGNPSESVSFEPCNKLAVSQVTPANNNISVYPNPADKQATVNFNAKRSGSYTIKLTDIYGQILLTKNGYTIAGTNSCILQLTGIAKGIYNIILQDESGVYNVKLVVK